MNRQRKTNRGLPRRVYLKHGAYFFVAVEPMRDPRDGQMRKWIRLAGQSEGEAAMLSALGKLLGDRTLDAGAMPHLCTEFRLKKLGKYSAAVQAQYGQFLQVIATAFKDFAVSDVTTKDWSDFLQFHYAGKANTAQKITTLGRKVFKYGISQLGLRKDNPLDQIDLGDYETKRREVLPTHEQVAAIRAAGAVGKDGRMTHSGPMFACLVDMAYLCWQRAVDVRTFTEAQIVPTASGELVGGHIKFKPSKTAKSSGMAVDIVITVAIADVIERARAIKRKHHIVSKYVFPASSGKSKGNPYTKSGLFSMWDRARERAKIADDIQFRDLRALAATDALRAGGDKSEAQKRLVHTTAKTTDVYIKEVIAAVSDLEVSLPWKASGTV